MADHTDLSFAAAAQTRGGRATIRMLENATGRMHVMRRGDGYKSDVAAGIGFFDALVTRYGLTLEVASGTLADIPRAGPLIVVANHPYGILDGLIMGHLLSLIRPDFKILANVAFSRAPQIDQHMLPISFETDKAARTLNIETRRKALDSLQKGGAIGVFPGGTVSTGARPFSHPMDPVWRRFTARMIAKSNATVLPLYFDGHTTKLFQIASHLHTTLRLGLLLREFRTRMDTPVRVVIGKPLPREELGQYSSDPTAMMDFLRTTTYGLAPEPLKCLGAGYDFEGRRKRR